MKLSTLIARLYTGFIALCATLTFALGLTLIFYPRLWEPGDRQIGLFLVVYNLIFAVPCWWHVIWWRPRWT